MKTLSLISVALLALTVGCNHAPAQNNGYGNHQISQAIPVQAQNQNPTNTPSQQRDYSQSTQAQNSSSENSTMHPVINPQTGQPSMYIPFPASWKFIDGAAQGKPAMKGPNGLTFIAYPPQTLIYTNDPSMNQAYQSNGMQVMAPVGIENTISNQLIPQGKQMGMTLQNQYPLPQIAAKDREYASKLYGSNSQQNTFQAAGTDWTDQEGNKVLVVLHYFEMRSSGSINWGYNVEMLKVHPANFAQAKSQYIYGMANKVFNQNEVNAYNNQLAGKLKSDNERFQAQQKIITTESAKRLENDRQTNAYIRNLKEESHDYRTHNNEVVQELENNYLNDVDVVVSPIDGKEYQVESGSKSYWINDEGKYIQSDNPLYDPNKYETRPDIWQKAPKKVYK